MGIDRGWWIITYGIFKRQKIKGQNLMEEDPKICELHKSLACEVDKGKFIRRMLGSKIVISIISTLFLLFISWCIWITNFTYVKAAEKSSERTISQKASKDMDEVKVEIKEIRNEIKSQTETINNKISNQTEAINKNQKDMLLLLMEIQKEQRRANGSIKKGSGE